MAWLPLLWVAWLAAGCSTARFYQQAVTGHTQIMWRKQRIETLLAHPSTRQPLKEKLALILDLRTFAEHDLALPTGEHYLHYADLERPFVVWDIYAAPEFSLDPKTWWYPFVGSLSYRGYFKEEQARTHAARLEDKGYDVFVGGIDAYSTLGWFKDPVLNTFIDRSPADVADLIFHELAHQRLFIDGDTDFNEAFASTVARVGVRRWMQIHQPASLAIWMDNIHREDDFLGLVLHARQDLDTLYQSFAAAELSGQPIPVEERRRRKAEVLAGLRAEYERLKTRWGGKNDFDVWFDYPVNNARLNAEATYYHLMPAFENLLAHHDNDLPRFYQAVEALGELEPEARLATLKSYAPEQTFPARTLVQR